MAGSQVWTPPVRKTHDSWAGVILVVTAVAAPLLVTFVARAMCGDDSCYGEVGGTPALFGFGVFFVGSVLAAVLSGQARPAAQRTLGWSMVGAAVPYGLVMAGWVGSALGGGDGDYAVMTFVGYGYGLGCVLLWLFIGLLAVARSRARLERDDAHVRSEIDTDAVGRQR